MFFIEGKKVFIRTVTNYFTGVIRSIDDSGIVLGQAAWIADTGRFADTLAQGTLSEVEPYPGDVYVARAAIVDACEWTHDLPRTQK